MRWASDTQRWVRPLHGIVAVFDGMALKGGLQMGAGRQVPFGATTHGHRVLAPAVFDVIGFDDYRVTVDHARVMVDTADRKSVAKGKKVARRGGSGGEGNIERKR